MEEQWKSSAMNERQEIIKRLLKMNPREFWQRAEALQRAILKLAKNRKKDDQNKDVP